MFRNILQFLVDALGVKSTDLDKIRNTQMHVIKRTNFYQQVEYVSKSTYWKLMLTIKVGWICVTYYFIPPPFVLTPAALTFGVLNS